MLQFLLRRIVAVLPVLFVVSLVVFLILRLAPGDPAAVIAGNSATNEDINRIREQLGLTKPLLTQFGIWLSGVVQGDLGYSFYLGKPVTDLIAQRIEPTLSLAVGTMLISVLVAVPLGTLAAWRMGGWLDRALSAFSVAGFSVPVFVIAYLLIYVFAMQLQWLPVQGYKPLSGPQSQGWLDWARQLVLPWLTLSTIYIALIARITRAPILCDRASHMLPLHARSGGRSCGFGVGQWSSWLSGHLAAVVVQQRGGVDELDHSSQVVALGIGVAQGACHEQEQGGANALAACRDDVLRHGAHQRHARIQALRDDAVNFCHIGSNQG